MSAVKKSKAPARAKYERIHKSNPIADADPVTKERIGQLEHYIMKNCLWQFNSRGWDRRKQNAGILSKTAQLLCDETVENPTPMEKCYWVDAVLLDEAFRERCLWLRGMAKEEIKRIMQLLHARIDWVTIDGSLNEELTVQNY